MGAEREGQVFKAIGRFVSQTNSEGKYGPGKALVEENLGSPGRRLIVEMETKHKVSCLPLRKPVLERQVLMQKKVVFSDAGHVEDGGLTSQSPCPWEDGGLTSQSPCPWGDGGLTSQSPSPPLNAGRDFSKEGEGNRTKRSREGVEKFSTCR